MTTKKVKLDLELNYAGWIAVDSGQAMVCDPVNLDKWNDNQKEEWNLNGREGEYSYQGATATTLAGGYGQLESATAVVFSTGHGDGLYPVYVHKDNNDVITKVVIDFVGEINFFDDENKAETETIPATTFDSKALIIGQAWGEHKNADELVDFFKYNDVGVPLAFAYAEGIITYTPTLEEYINETFDLLLEALDIEDAGFDDLPDLWDALEALGLDRPDRT
jgi:hypothetical protein